MSTPGTTPQSPQYLRVFLASPGDVADERALALTVLGNCKTIRCYGENHPGDGGLGQAQCEHADAGDRPGEQN